MPDVDRRFALTLGLVATSGFANTSAAAAEAYEADFGMEVAPGVRQVELGNRVSTLPTYKAISMRDIVFQPRANTYDPAVQNDMICHITDGYLRVRQGESEWVAKKGTGPWTSAKGTRISYRNIGQEVAIVRVIDLVAT
jgi:hypothetical protein